MQTPLLLGPSIADASFSSVAIKSIHYKRLPVAECVAGQTAAVALKKVPAPLHTVHDWERRSHVSITTEIHCQLLQSLFFSLFDLESGSGYSIASGSVAPHGVVLQVKRDQVRKGMVLVHKDLKPAASWEFDAEIAILTHSTTIQPRYQAVIHCEIIRQAARVVAMNKERLRSGDRARVRFRFIQHPEYLTDGTRFVFREGRTKGIGMVVGTEGMKTTMPIPGGADASES